MDENLNEFDINCTSAHSCLYGNNKTTFMWTCIHIEVYRRALLDCWASANDRLWELRLLH